MQESSTPIMSSQAEDTPSGSTKSEDSTHSDGRGSPQSLDLNDGPSLLKDNSLQSSCRDSFSKYLSMSFFLAPSKNKLCQDKLSAVVSDSSVVDESHDSEGQQQYSLVQSLGHDSGIYLTHLYTYNLNC